ncbi:leucyl aminopeptidase [Candidatus Micrarchaeota archaeon]|nr:leucyl aminopeptidase [Candidatus Micrarchaeota archaeon]
MKITTSTSHGIFGLVCFPLLLESKIPSVISGLLKDVKKERFEFKLGQTLFFDLGKVKYLIVGLGKKEEFKAEFIRRAGGIATRYCASLKEGEFSLVFPSELESECVSAAIEGAVLASYKSTEFKSKTDDIFIVSKMTLVCSKDVGAFVQRGSILGNAQNYARFLDEKPANIATPLTIAAEAKRLAKELGFKTTVFEEKELEKMGMGGILGVCAGSANEPVLLKLEYNSDKKNLPLYCIVGKGVTFDTGGISIKPSKNMHEMKYDKTGAMNVLGVFKAVSELALPVRLLGLMPMVENMPSGVAQRPGDIVKAYNGKTIEVLNTDAEGRLILADALAYAAEHKPEFIIDMATLTGAIVVSLGRFAIGMFSNDDALSQSLSDAGENTHERVWRLPLWPEYGEFMKSDFADLKNISELDEAGSITAAAFLKEFVGDCKWAHLDIAAVDLVKWSHPYLDKGASGIGVRLVTNVLESKCKKN